MTARYSNNAAADLFLYEQYLCQTGQSPVSKLQPDSPSAFIAQQTILCFHFNDSLADRTSRTMSGFYTARPIF
jgi:hypothetical protein